MREIKRSPGANLTTIDVPAQDVVSIAGVNMTLAGPDQQTVQWIDYNDYLRQLQAAWLRLTDDEIPLNPRIAGGPGIGKTTLVRAAGELLQQDV